MEENKKPFYKKTWFWVVAAIVILAIIFGETPEPTERNTQDEPIEEMKEPIEEDEHEEVEEPDEEEALAVEYDDEFLFGEFTVNEFKTEIRDNELKLSFYWINQSGRDDIPFTAVGYFDVLQGEAILNEISGVFDPGARSDALRRVDHGIMSPVTLIYEIENDEPVEASFYATSEYDDTKEILIIEVE